MLHTIKPAHGSVKKRKRIARGNSAGGGTTAGRGTKGQHARTGKGMRFGFEGGQTPLVRRQPKLGGFTSPRRVEYAVINVSDLETLESGSYSENDLRSKRVVTGSKPVKVLGDGKLTKKVNVSVHAVSKSAKAAIEKAGGSVTIVKN